MKFYAKGLSRLILRVRELVGLREGAAFVPENFRCYLVAHSMGGLVVRAFLQNKALGDPQARAAVDKVFTYATPHNGIDVAGINVPSWLSASEINTFNRDKMADFLDTPPVDGRIDYLPASDPAAARALLLHGRLQPRRLRGGRRASRACSPATAATGWCASRTHRCGRSTPTSKVKPVASAFAYRSHSGYFGIVNSEEAYQNLARFLFGDVRVDLWFDVESVALPPDIPKDAEVDALYQVELLAAPRGKRWYLSRRIAEEDSPACRTHKELTDPAGAERSDLPVDRVPRQQGPRGPEPPHAGLRDDAGRARAGLPGRPEVLARRPLRRQFAVPRHAGHRDDAARRRRRRPQWGVKYGWQTETAGRASLPISYKQMTDGKLEFMVPLSTQGAALSAPGITGRVRLEVSAWN